MSLQKLNLVSSGAAAESGTGPGSLYAILAELQGLNINLVTGGSASTKFNLAAIRQEDTIVAAFNNNAGTLTDIKANITIADTRASGTLTLSGIVADDTAVVNGVTYTFKASPNSGDIRQVQLTAGNNNANAAALSAAINKYNDCRGSYVTNVSATVLNNVVTVTANSEGTDANSYGLVGGTHITASAATLAGGTTTGGILSSSVTNQIILFWFNKNP